MLKSAMRLKFSRRGYTVIAVAHRLDAVTASMRPGKDLVVWISEGKIEKIGDAEEILGSQTTDERPI